MCVNCFLSVHIVSTHELQDVYALHVTTTKNGEFGRVWNSASKFNCKLDMVAAGSTYHMLPFAIDVSFPSSKLD